MPFPPPSDPPRLNNADSFSQEFDDAWRSLGTSGIDGQARLERVLEMIGDHPFLLENPERARQVADFRIRLLGL